MRPAPHKYLTIQIDRHGVLSGACSCGDWSSTALGTFRFHAARVLYDWLTHCEGLTDPEAAPTTREKLE